MRTAVLGLITVVIAMAVGLPPVAVAEPVDPAICGTPLSTDELDTIARLSDISTLTGDPLQRLETAIAASGQVIIDRTEEIYHGDLGPLWRFYFVGEGLDLLLGAGVATGPLLRAADLGYNVVVYGNGLALQDPGLHNATATEIRLLSDSVETALDVLTLLRGL